MDTITPEMALVREEMEGDKPGLFMQLLGEGNWPHLALGRCLEPMVVEGSLMFTDSRLDIRKGDLVAYASQGLPALGCKVFLGDAAGTVFFWSNQPAAVYCFDYRQLVHVARVSYVKTPGKPVADPRNLDYASLLPEPARDVIARLDDLPFLGPKEADLFKALAIVHEGIADAFSALPKENLMFFSNLRSRK
ncbi:hypothetical protein EPK99_24980 [Neorhizobium lilium]|uniref:Uncharacterized protein n=1 Tax=Neorhizobium lilium TaxID=2503024 RepID=A0A444LA35_9HYPH|nr:hypothetical protein [Neorhizobium lilium]RWX74441.1 hypothetical protein EPK99_24980 [Neorhizobium lilium]